MLPTLALLVPLAASAAAQTDWPHLRGPRLDGTAPAEGALARGFGLRLAWQRPLGPAYSGIAVADGVALTTWSDGTADRVVALDARTGAERWSRELEPTYRGHDGSEDGPIATPALGGGRAFVASARGKLVALALEGGAPLWSRDLVAELGTPVPEYGFAGTPLLEGGHLIVQAGGSEGRFLCALDPATGATRWTSGTGELHYASPVAMDLAGRRQVVALAGKKVLAVAPEDGAVLWELALGERDAAHNGVATPMGDGERFFADVGGAVVVYAVTRAGDGYAVEERARVRELGRTYAAPVHADGRLWGFKNEFLTCVDAATGARLWKSRPPGGRGLILVGDRLIVFGAQGVVAAVDTDDGDYRELARCDALDATSYVWPSYADGRVFVRNSAGIACVELVPEGAAPAPTPASPATTAGSGAFAAFLGELAGAADAGARVAAFLAEHPSFPVREADRVHFVWVGAAEDVAIAGSMLDGSQPDALARVPGTDLWHRSYAIEPGARWEYRFQVDYGDWVPDPRNPRRVPGTWLPEVSEVLTEGYVESAHCAPRADGPRGRLEELEFVSASLGNARTLRVYLPAGYDDGDAAHPLLVVHEGTDWLAKGGLAHALDNLIGASVRPLVAVFVPAMDEWWFEGGGTGTEEYVDALADELVPLLAGRYRLVDEPAARALLGKESFGMTALLGPLRRPETFGKAGVLSLSLGDRARHAIRASLAAGPPPGLAVFLGWNRYEARNQDHGYDFGADSRAMADELRAGGVRVAGGERLDSHGWGGWRAETAELLTALFPSR